MAETENCGRGDKKGDACEAMLRVAKLTRKAELGIKRGRDRNRQIKRDKYIDERQSSMKRDTCKSWRDRIEG